MAARRNWRIQGTRFGPSSVDPAVPDHDYGIGEQMDRRGPSLSGRATSIDFNLSVCIDGLGARYRWRLCMGDTTIHLTSYDFQSFAEAEDDAKRTVTLMFSAMIRNVATPSVYG